METVSAVVDRPREVAQFAGVLVLVFVLVALANHVVTDPTWLTAGPGPVRNPCGPLGAFVAAGLYAAFGYGAWASFVVLVSLVLSLAGRWRVDAPKAASVGVLFLAVLGMLHLGIGTRPVSLPAGAAAAGVSVPAFRAGGWLGVQLATAVKSTAGTTGAWILLLSAAALCLTVLWRLSWTGIASSAVRAGESALPMFGRGLGGWLKRMRGAGASSAKGDAPVWRMARALTRFDDEEEERSRWEGTGTVEGVSGEPGVRPPDSVVDLSSTLPAASVRLGEVRYTESEVSDSGRPPLHTPTPVGRGTNRTPSASDHARVFPQMSPAASPYPAQTRGPLVRPPPELAELARSVDPLRARPAPSTPPIAPPSLLFDPEVGFGSPRQPAVGAPRGATTVPLSSSASSGFRPQAGQYDARGAGRASDVRPYDPASRGYDAHLADTVGLDGATPSSAPQRHDRPGDERPGSLFAGGYEPVTPTAYGYDSVEDAPLRAANLFELPRLTLLDPIPEQRHAVRDQESLTLMSERVESTLESFKVFGKVTDVRVGPVVTTLEFLPEKGITVRRVASLADDLAMNLCATSVRIVAPIPGKGVVGIEIPSDERVTIYLRELLASPQFSHAATQGYALPVVLGKDVEGNPLVSDLARMPHLLVGGTTGSGKSVGVNGMLMSLLFRKTPDELKLLLVDPKKLEFKLYEDIPHLLHPVVVEPKRAAAALAWACREMERRYELIARWGVRSIDGYNARVDQEMKDWNASKIQRYSPSEDFDPDWTPERLPYIVIVIDELADLMFVARKEVESSIARLTQMARACGIHLIVATQRPSVDVVTGLIKSNLPTRLSFKLRSGVDSRTILDQTGAEALLGRGDSLYLPPAGDLARVHGPFVSDQEVERVMDYLRSKGKPKYIEAITADADESTAASFEDQEVDTLYHEAVAAVRAAGKASTSLVQRHLKIGYNRAARIIDQMELRGVVGPADGARAREVYPADHDDPEYPPAAAE